MDAALRAPEFTPDQVAELARAESRVVPGRGCGSCSMCCKVPSIEELGKPAGQWCRHCRPGKGCAIYDTRPYSCRGHFCEWMLSTGLGAEWKPDKAKIVLVRRPGRLTAHVDPGFPGAWRRTPFYENIKAWAAAGLQKSPQMEIVDVMIGEHAIIVLPDREVEVGVVAADEVVVVDRIATPQGLRYNVRKAKRETAAA